MMMVKRGDGYEGVGQRKDDKIHFIVKLLFPAVMTFLMFVVTCLVGGLSFYYKQDRENMKYLILQVSSAMIELKKDVDNRFSENSRERTRLVEKNELDKNQMKREIAEVRYSCCSEKKRGFN